MNQLGREHVAGQARMARVLAGAPRRPRGLAAFLHKLVGLESKMRQYEVGEAFVAAVEREAGPAGDRRRVAGPGVAADARRARTTRASWLARVGSRVTASTAAGRGPARAVRERGSPPRRSVLAAPRRGRVLGRAPIRSRCSCSRPTPGSRRRGARRPRAAPRQRGRRRRTWRARRARLGAPWSARVACRPSRRARTSRNAARDARVRRAGAPRASSTAPTAVLVAHTADDQAETVLLNVLRGAAAAGLAGMAPRRGIVVRPLLGLRRAETARARAPRSGSASSTTR